MRCRKRAITALMTTCLSATTAAFAQTTGGGYAESEVTVEQLANVRPLSLADAIALGLANNLDVEVSRYQPYISQLESQAAWGAYDPLFESNGTYFDSVKPVSNLFQGIGQAAEENTAVDAGVKALIPYVGASVQLGYDTEKSNSSQIFQRLRPSFESGLTFGANVPLMRGLIWNEAWTQVKSSGLAYDAELDNFTASIMDALLPSALSGGGAAAAGASGAATARGIIGAYWSLVAAKEEVRVAEKALEANRALLDQTNTQYQVGVVSKVEVVQAEAGVASSEFDLIVRQNDYRNAQDVLIAAVLGDRLRADSTLVFDPTDDPEYTTTAPVDLNQAVGTAFAKRPELAAAQKRIDQGEVQLRFAKNQRLPKLDFGLQYRTLGVSGQPTPANPALPGGALNPDVVGDWGSSNDFFNGNRDVTAMGTLSIPLGNISGRKNVTKARIELRRANTQVTRLRQQIIVEVRKAARGLLASAQGVEAAERQRLAAEEQLRAETIRLEHGESTPFDVLLRQRDLVEAESRKIQALRSYRLSKATLEREQGTILDERNISISSVRKLPRQ